MTRRPRALPAIAIIVSMLPFIVQHPASAAPQDSAGRPPNSDLAVADANCKMLQSAGLATLQDAPTRITEAKWVKRHGAVPSYCRVHGYVEPQVGFEMLLPALRWNRKFIEMGCGGACGSIDSQACGDPLRRHYACIVSDAGHRGNGGEWAWAKDNLQARIDYGYRGPHVTAIAGKALTRLYYHRPPRESYFDGCSTGGRW
jgi:hypothetical protein